MYASINRSVLHNIQAPQRLMERHAIICILELFRQPLLDLLHFGSPRTLESEAKKQTSHICFGRSYLKHFFFFYDSDGTV